MSKITTADCVAAIHRQAKDDLPASVAALKPDWKRVSKTGGKAGRPITRVFSSKQAPWVKAVVVESPEGLRVQFAQRHWWEIPYTADVDADEVDAWLGRPEIKALQGPRPQDFTFGVTAGDDLMDGESGTAVYLSPLCNPEYDQHLGEVVGELLPIGPDGEPAGEVCESTFIVGIEDQEALKLMMIARGFVHDPGLDGELGA